MSDEPLEVVKKSENVTVEGVEITTKTPEELLEKLNSIGAELRALIVDSKKLPRSKGLEPHQDPIRSLSLAQMYMQTGFMWMRKALGQNKEF